MIKTIARGLAMVSAVFLAASCSETRSASVSQPAVIKGARSAYVVKHQDSNREIETYLKNALNKKGVRAQAGPMSAKPANTDLQVTFVDRWHWDMTMYLRTLDVSVVDKSGREVATGTYRNSALHGYPDPQKTSEELINLIYERAN
ncbi:MAG TPA: hypothetical protein VGE67_03275 [Haloferula sp.]